MTTISSLADILTLQESMEVECKLAGGKDNSGKIPVSIWDTYSSFANTHGGEILLGLKEKNGEFVVKGIQDSSRLIDELFSTLNNPSKVNLNLLDNHNVKVVKIDGCDVVHIHVPPANRTQKPIYINGNPLKGTFKRLNTGDQRCTEEEVKRLLAEQVEDSRDSKPLDGFTFDDIDPETFSAYRNIFRSAKPDHPYVAYGDEEFLRCIGGWDKDRVTGKGRLNLAGLLMFGKLPSIVDALPNYLLDYQERPEAKKESRWVDRVTLDGTWSGNLFDFYRIVMKKLTQDLKIPFQLVGDKRQGETTIHTVLRESLINTLVHSDYTERVSVLVVKRPDMFGFRNPGLMRIPIEQAISGGLSDCRNRKIHQMFLLIGLGERAGSGIPKIYSGWKSQNWTSPKIHEKENPPQTLLELSMVDLFSPKVSDFLEKFLGEVYSTLSKDEKFILSIIYAETYTNHQRLMELTDHHPSDLSALLSNMEKRNLLSTSGVGRNKVYTIFGFKEDWMDPFFLSTPKNTEVGNLSIEAGEPRAVAGDLRAAAGDLRAVAGDLKDQIEWKKLTEIGRPIAEKKRANKQDVENVILRICEDQFVQLHQLAKLLNRDGKVLRRNYLSNMVEEKKLYLAFSTTPNHPRQGYRTRKVTTPSDDTSDESSEGL